MGLAFVAVSLLPRLEGRAMLLGRLVAVGLWLTAAGCAEPQRLSQRSSVVVDAPRQGDHSPTPATGSIYFVMVDRFANGDRANDGDADPEDAQGFHGGDLRGVRDHLDWLQALHVKTVWLSPVFRMRTAKYGPHGGYHGYWVEDLTRVEPRFGDQAQLAALADDLHARGMRLVLDVVLNHAAPDGELVKRKPEWFHHQGGITDWNDPVQLLTHDVHGLPDFADERPDVFDYLLSSSIGWLAKAHVDGFRLDAVKHLPLSFWARFNLGVERAAGPGFERLGELLDGNSGAVSRTWREGGFNQMFDFPLRFAMIDVFCGGQSPAKLAAVLTDDRRYPDPRGLVTLLDNHDLPRVMTECHGERARVEEALAFQLTARGVPSLIWGTELGFEGESEPANRASMRFDGPAPFRALIASLLQARARHPALADGAPVVLLARAEALAVLRVTAHEAALTVVNHTGQPLVVPLPAELAGATWRDVLTDAASGASFGPGVTTRVVSVQVPALAAAAHSQWTTGARRRTVEISARGGAPGETLLAVGSGVELGSWSPASGLVLPARAELPVGGVFELKLVAQAGNGAARWEPGRNRVVFVEAGAGPLKVDLTWGDT